MTDKNFYDDQDPMARLRLWGLGQMMWGAGIAAMVIVAILVGLYVIWGLGQFLPEESKQAPSPYGAIEIVQTTSVV